MIARKLAFPAGAQKSVLSGFGHASRRWRFNLEKRNSLDRDARAFIEKAGIKNGQGRQQISDYVRGLKAMGLWGRVVSFPLRFHQNAPSGSTMYGLGKDFEDEEFSAGINGTMTRTSLGLASPDSGNYLDLGRHAIADINFSIGGCVRIVNAIGVSGELFQQSDSVFQINGYANGNVVMVVYPSDLNNSLSDIPPITNFSSAFGFFQFTANAEIFTAKKNAEAQSSSTFEEISTGRSENSIIANIRCTMPFFFFCSFFTINNSQQNKFYSLYKSTLGQGLGLP